MNKFLSISVALIIALKASAINISSEIKSVTVFQQGAKITHIAQVNLDAGNNEVVIENLTSTIDANSIQAGIKGQAVLLSATSRINYLMTKKASQRVKELQDSLTLLINRIDWVKNEQEIYRGEEKLVIDNQKIVNEKEKVSANDIALLADFYRNRLTDIRKKIYSNEIELKQLNERKVQVDRQLNDLRSVKNAPTGEIVLNISAEQPVKVNINLSYITFNAGWNPLYDIRGEGNNQSIDLLYKANIYQQTGFDWSGINLTVSTGNPSASNERPILNPWYIDFVQPYKYSSDMKRKESMMMKAAPASNMAMLADEAIAPEEVSAPVPYNVVETTNQMAVEYEIKVKQDIPADGKEHIVAISNFKIPATYKYHSVPKLDPHTFLLASIGGYGEYNLMPGTANLFFEGTYVGQSTINPEVTADTMLISLGRDDRVKIERNILKDLSSKQFIGTNKKELKGYEIMVRNNKKVAITIDILDQVPISSNKDIIVELEEHGGATYNADYGKLNWLINLAPGETKKIRFVYSVKYPKDKEISGLY